LAEIEAYEDLRVALLTIPHACGAPIAGLHKPPEPSIPSAFQ
jgi:hypothetical protein